jgi:tetratricopeptide (TPR) repeat protein
VTEPTLRSLRAEFEAIRAALAETRNPADREPLKRRLAELYRSTDALLTGATRLKEELRALAEAPRPAAVPGAGPATRPPEPRSAGVRQDRLGASTYLEKGWHLITLGDHAGAVTALQRALDLAPDDPQGRALLGWAQMLGGAHDDAMATFARVLERDPDNALARVNIGYICLQKRVFGEAIEHLSRAIRVDSDRKATLYAHYYLGLVYLEREMFDDAASFLERAVALGPNLVEARYELGRARWFGGQRDAARLAWTAGAAAGSFSPWAARCRQLLELVEAGGEVPRYSLP